MFAWQQPPLSLANALLSHTAGEAEACIRFQGRNFLADPFFFQHNRFQDPEVPRPLCYNRTLLRPSKKDTPQCFDGAEWAQPITLGLISSPIKTVSSLSL